MVILTHLCWTLTVSGPGLTHIVFALFDYLKSCPYFKGRHIVSLGAGLNPLLEILLYHWLDRSNPILCLDRAYSDPVSFGTFTKSFFDWSLNDLDTSLDEHKICPADSILMLVWPPAACHTAWNTIPDKLFLSLKKFHRAVIIVDRFDSCGTTDLWSSLLDRKSQPFFERSGDGTFYQCVQYTRVRKSCISSLPLKGLPLNTINRLWFDDFTSKSRPAVAPFRRTLVGLTGLSNTCYMNSILQCLCCIPVLQSYFCKDTFLRDLSTVSRTEGQLTLSFASLVSSLTTSPDFTVAKSVSLSTCLSAFALQFRGYLQHDCHEFLRFLLDGLHTDLNRVKQKPPLRNFLPPIFLMRCNHFARGPSTMLTTTRF